MRLIINYTIQLQTTLPNYNELHLLHQNYIISHLHQTTSHYTTPNHTARHYTDYTYFTKLQHISPNYNTLHQTTPPLPNYTALLYTELHRITPNYFVLSKLPACFKSQWMLPFAWNNCQVRGMPVLMLWTQSNSFSFFFQPLAFKWYTSTVIWSYLLRKFKRSPIIWLTLYSHSVYFPWPVFRKVWWFLVPSLS